jgi:hypothetical protein
MNKLTLLIVGLIAGWLAEQIMGRSQTLIMNLVLGTAGAFLGGKIPQPSPLPRPARLLRVAAFTQNGRRVLALASPLQARPALS